MCPFVLMPNINRFIVKAPNVTTKKASYRNKLFSKMSKKEHIAKHSLLEKKQIKASNVARPLHRLLVSEIKRGNERSKQSDDMSLTLVYI